MNTADTFSRRLPPFEGLAMVALLAGGFGATAPANAASIVDLAVAAPSLVGANSVDASDWMAESFALTAAAAIGSVAVQLLDASPSADAGRSFLLAIYAGASGLPGLNFNAADQGRLYSASVAYVADGWNGASGLQWQLAPGTYWLAVESSGDAAAVTSLVLPAGAQPVPTGVAFYSGSSTYSATGSADAFGLRIDSVAAAVPEPGTWVLTLVGLTFLAFGRNRSGPRTPAP